MHLTLLKMARNDSVKPALVLTLGSSSLRPRPLDAQDATTAHLYSTIVNAMDVKNRRNPLYLYAINYPDRDIFAIL